MSNESSYTWTVTRPQVQFLGLGTLAAIAALAATLLYRQTAITIIQLFSSISKKVWLPDSRSHIPCEKREVWHQWAERSDVLGEETYSSWLTVH